MQTSLFFPPYCTCKWTLARHAIYDLCLCWKLIINAHANAVVSILTPGQFLSDACGWLQTAESTMQRAGIAESWLSTHKSTLV